MFTPRIGLTWVSGFGFRLLCSKDWGYLGLTWVARQPERKQPCRNNHSSYLRVLTCQVLGLGATILRLVVWSSILVTNAIDTGLAEPNNNSFPFIVKPGNPTLSSMRFEALNPKLYNVYTVLPLPY